MRDSAHSIKFLNSGTVTLHWRAIRPIGAHQPSRRRPAPQADERPFTIETDGTRKLGAATGWALAEAAAALWANCGAGGSV